MKRGMTLKELSEKSGISAAHLSDLERGKKSPTLRALMKLSVALDVCPHKLVCYDFFCREDCRTNCSECE